ANAGLQFTGSGPINLTGSSIGTVNGIFGGFAYIGTDWATYDGSSNVVAYASYTDIATGAIVSAPASNVRYISDTGNLTPATGTTINSLLAQIGAARSISIPANGVLKLGSKGGIYRNSSASATLTVASVSRTAMLTASGGGELTRMAPPG